MPLPTPTSSPLAALFLTTVALAAAGPAQAHPPAGALGLLPLYAEQMLSAAASACAVRAPASGEALSALLRQLQTRERAVLARASQTAETLERDALAQAVNGEDADRRQAALEVLMEVQGQKMGSGQLVLQALAQATDRQAGELCERHLAQMRAPGWLERTTEEGLTGAQALRRQMER